ncbi:MAG: PDZ domain-containing protein [Aquificae bacterium]|nr:PDZ domain-containing protein [Aquificota bacterium]
MKKSFLLILILFIVSCENRQEDIAKINKKLDEIYLHIKKERYDIERLQEQISKVVSDIYPIVVTIFTYQKEGKEKLHKTLKYFEEINPFESESLGSGFVIRKDKENLYIVTNAHVIGKSKKIIIKFYNGYETQAQIQGIDQKTDIAVLKVKNTDMIRNIKPAKCGTIQEMKIGYFVIAAGSPYSLGHTFTFGIISALGRNLGISTFENFIQTDAAINPGDSGGPLINVKGEVIGMNTAIIQTGQGIGFAIPIDVVVSITDELIKHKKIIRGWLGVLVQNIPHYLKEKYNLSHGVLIIKVFDTSPAQKSGLEVGDIILSLNGKNIKNASNLKYLISQLKPGENITLRIFREGKILQIKINIEKSPTG